MLVLFPSSEARVLLVLRANSLSASVAAAPLQKLDLFCSRPRKPHVATIVINRVLRSPWLPSFLLPGAHGKPASFSTQRTPPDLSLVISAAFSHLKSCPRRLPKLHALLVASGLARSPFFAGKLIAGYSDLRDTSTASSVFLSTPSSGTSVFLWNSLIRAHVRNAMFSDAVRCYDKMQSAKLSPDAYTFPSVINACAGLFDLKLGRKVHERAVEMGFGLDLYVGNSLVDMYSRAGSLIEACAVFDRMTDKDIVSWNSLISGFSANGKWEEAAEVYGDLRMTGLVPDCFTVESVLPAFGGLTAVDDGQATHGLAYKTGILEDTSVNNGFISMYCRIESLNDARKIFDRMIHRDTVSWNTMIDGYHQSGDPDTALKLFRDMTSGAKSDVVTVTILLHICNDLGAVQLGRSIHGYMLRNGYDYDIAANNALLSIYGNFASLSMMHKLFDRMVQRDSVTWNSLINCYLSRSNFTKVVETFKSMIGSDLEPDFVTMAALISMCTKLLMRCSGMGFHSDGIKRGLDSNLLVKNALLDMYCKCDGLQSALEEFERMDKRDSASWNTIIAGCIHNGNCALGFKLLSCMKLEGQALDRVTILSILPACSFVAAKRLGKEVHGCIYKLGLENDIPTGNALIEMYSKCGNLRHAVRTFNHMSTKDVLTWTALVYAYGMYGEGEKALSSFSRMEEMCVIPDEVAFLAVIYACSHAGLVEEGKRYFKRMKENYNMIPRMEHYACMVDLLARSGKLLEAHKFIEDMPIEPDVSVWGMLLSACRISGESIIAESVAKKITSFNTENTGYLVLVSNFYASLGKWDMVGKVRKSMKSKMLKKDQGFSWIEIKSKVYVFETGDKLVEQSEEVHQLLEVLAGLMAKEGYIPDRKFVFQDVEEDDKHYMLCTHSERLAIAFGLLNTEPGTPLKIMKNLRACGDCHTATKYISKIVQREILVRDANRFHLFKDGFCSCRDYW